jgi:hypothetical protein
MPETSSIFLWAAKFFGFFTLLFMGVPCLGAWFMHRGFERAKMPGPTLKQCMQAYFLASSVTIVVVFGIHFYFRATKRSGDESLPIFLASYVVPQLLFVPVFLRNFSQRSLLIQEGAIVLANVIVLGLLWFIFFV